MAPQDAAVGLGGEPVGQLLSACERGQLRLELVELFDYDELTSTDIRQHWIFPFILGRSNGISVNTPATVSAWFATYIGAF